MKRKLIIFLFIFAVNTQCLLGGNFSSLDVTGGTFTFSLSGTPSVVKLIICKEDIIRVMISDTGSFQPDSMYLDYYGPYQVEKYDWPSTSFSYNAGHADRVEIETDSLKIKCWKSPFKISIYTKGDVLINEDFDPTAETLKKTMFSDEHFYGFGTARKEGALDYRGQIVDIINTIFHGAAGWSQSQFFMSTRGYGMSIPTWNDCSYDFTGSGYYTITGGKKGPHKEYYFYYGPSLKRILDLYTQVTGRPGFLPKYHYGVAYHGYWEESEWKSNANKIRNEDFRGDIIRIDSNFNDKTRYPSDISPVTNQHFYFSIWIATYELSLFCGESQPSQDSTSPAWHDWFFNDYHQCFYNVGLTSYKVDRTDQDGPGLPVTNLVNNGPAIDLTDNLERFLWIKSVYDRTAHKSGGRGAVFERYGYGTHRFATIWDGDTYWGSSFENRVIRNHLGMGLSGYASYTFDMTHILSNPPSGEDVRRCFEFALLGSVPDVFNKSIWAYPTADQEVFKEYTKLRYELMPYIYSTAWHAHQTGTPIMRAMVLDYQDDSNCQQEIHDYMLGDYIFISPVIPPKSTDSIYLPAGEWIDWRDGTVYTGPTTLPSYPVPSDIIPIFAKGGAIIPRGPDMEYVDEIETDPLTVEIYPYGTSTYTLYEDNGGHTSGWQNHTLTNFTCMDTATDVQVDFNIVNNGYGIPDRTYIYKVRWYEKPYPTEVSKGGVILTHYAAKPELDAAAEGWWFDTTDKITYTKIHSSGVTNVSLLIQVGDLIPTQMVCHAEPSIIYIEEVSQVIAEIKDDSNFTVTDATHPVTFSKSGPGLLVGSVTRDPVNGIATINLLSQTTPGTVTVSATAGGLNRGTVDVIIRARPVATALLNTASPESIVADGLSTSLVKAVVADQYNEPMTGTTNTITFSVSGEGSLLGTTTKPAVNGEATVQLRSVTTAGTAVVTATAAGLYEGSVNVVIDAGPAMKIISTAKPAAIRNDGISISTITAGIHDTNDNAVTTASDWIMFSVSTTTYATLLTGPTRTLLITNINVYSGKLYVQAIVNEGNEFYIDRSYTIVSIPMAYEGLDWIKTANEDKFEATNPFLTFDINVGVTVYVGIDTRLAVPGWLSGWTDTGDIISGGEDFNLYSRDYSAGAVSLGGNQAGSANSSMYIVLLRQLDSGANLVKAENGIAIIGLQSTTSSGTTTVTAISDGLGQGAVNVVTTVDLIPVKIINTAEPISICADGLSTSLVTARICDSGNNLVITAANTIAFSISGEGSLLDTTTKPAVSGQATVRFQSTTDVGTATVTSQAGGLTEGNVEVIIVPGDADKLINTAELQNILADGLSTSIITTRVYDANDNLITSITGGGGFGGGFTNANGGEWAYRKEITINSGSALSDYQVHITESQIGFGGHAQGDYDDVRFTDNGDTELSYWIGTKGGVSGFWVKVPTVNNGNTTLYVYYGNALATTVSNIKATFIFGDDFNDETLDTGLWTWVRESAGDWNEGTSRTDWLMIRTLQDKDLYQTDNDAPVLRAQTDIGSQDIEAVVNIQLDPTANYQQAGLMIYSDDDNFVKVCKLYHTSAGGKAVEFSNELSAVFNRTRIAETAVDLMFKITRQGTTYTGYYSSNSGANWTQIDQFTGLSLLNSYPALTAYAGGTVSVEIDAYFDSIRIRKYVSTEPTVTGIGTEETGSGGLEITLSVTGQGNLLGTTVKEPISGIVTILLQSTTTMGTATVTSTAAGVTEGTVEVWSVLPKKIINTADPTSIIADGISTSLIKASICDADNLPVTIATNTITFSVSGVGSLLDTTIKPANSGEATIRLQSAGTTGTAIVRATSSGLSEGVVNVGIEDKHLDIIASPVGIIADGVSISTVTVTIMDGDNQPVVTATDQIGFVITDSSLGSLEPPTTKNAVDGVATIIFKSKTKLGEALVIANSDLGAEQVGITLTYGPGSKITCTADPVSIMPDNLDKSLVSAMIVDDFEHPVTTAANLITFNVDDNGELTGQNPVNAVDGIATIYVTITSSAAVTAESGVLTPGMVEITSIENGEVRFIDSGGAFIGMEKEIIAELYKGDQLYRLSGKPVILRIFKDGNEMTDMKQTVLTNEDGMARFSITFSKTTRILNLTAESLGFAVAQSSITVLVNCIFGGSVIKEDGTGFGASFQMYPWGIFENFGVEIKDYNEIEEQQIKNRIDQANSLADNDGRLNFIRDFVKSTLYEFTTYDNNYTPKEIDFRNPTTVSISYNDEDNNEIVDGTDICIWDLRIFLLDEDNGEWVQPEDVQGVNRDNQCVTIHPTHFSVYCVMGIEQEGDEIRKATTYPNPFSDETTFIFSLGFEPSDVEIKIYSISGRLIRNIGNDEINGTMGKNEVTWDGNDGEGKTVSNGIYYYKINATTGEGASIGKTGKAVRIK